MKCRDPKFSILFPINHEKLFSKQITEVMHLVCALHASYCSLSLFVHLNSHYSGLIAVNATTKNREILILPQLANNIIDFFNAFNNTEDKVILSTNLNRRMAVEMFRKYALSDSILRNGNVIENC